MENVPDINLLQQTLSSVENLRYLDEGGFKAVYRGYIRGGTEAIKVIYIPRDFNEEDRRNEIIGRVQREVEALNECVSPYIVSLGSLPPELFEIGGYEYIIYSEEFLDGESLRVKIRQGYEPDFSELKRLAACLFKAVEVLKINDLIHRDIKPGNVIALQTEDRPFVILDLGIAFKLHGTALTRDSRYRPGTLPYMAPEMFNPRFRETLDYRSDLYSAGVTIYEFASRQHPIARRGEDDYTTMYRIINLPSTPLSTHRADLPDDFCGIVDQLTRIIHKLKSF